ncbi:MAG: nitroreductase family protein [Candidatus Bathyarchaeota archaeon]|nr:MAG: nitroreductase family protein [Candidatus Bathyarchaeota archaeon]
MSILDTIKERGSIRRYMIKPIPRDELLKVVEAARLAQSAANRQPWQFILVTDDAVKKNLAVAARNQRFVGEAAAVMVCLANPEESARVGPFEGFLIDLAIAIENMTLTGWDLGIGSCWIGAFNENDVKDLLDIPENLRVVSLLTLGYPDEKPRTKNRKSLKEILHHERYGRIES